MVLDWEKHLVFLSGVIFLVLSPSPTVSQARYVTLLLSTGWITGENSLPLHGVAGRNEWVYTCKIMKFFQEQHKNFGGIQGQKVTLRVPGLSFVFPLRKRFSFLA